MKNPLFNEGSEFTRQDDSIMNNSPSERNRVILENTSNIETLIGLDPRLQVNSPSVKSLEYAPIKSPDLLVLWCVLLIVQVLMFWRQKK